jgi:hypothetical protein
VGKDFGSHVLGQFGKLRLKLVADFDVPSHQSIMACNTYGVKIISNPNPGLTLEKRLLREIARYRSFCCGTQLARSRRFKRRDVRTDDEAHPTQSPSISTTRTDNIRSPTTCRSGHLKLCASKNRAVLGRERKSSFPRIRE